MSWTKRIAVLAAVSTALSMLLAGVGSAVSQAVPSNTSLPSIGGSAKDGSVLTADHGTWTDSPQSYAYAWERCDTAGGTCASIAGATSKQYTVITADVGHRLRVVVTATSGAAPSTPWPWTSSDTVYPVPSARRAHGSSSSTPRQRTSPRNTAPSAPAPSTGAASVGTRNAAYASTAAYESADSAASVMRARAWRAFEMPPPPRAGR